ncbi:unnamed protein product [Brachionus calyciflorus]|uniref:Uncharacterized protein n=1 Tax=Brachionus calyciflorus TaxID=104777 RepID=A0A814DYK8_9BILA|nr:unnamed protein product [Brachionus calyciflorus]
MTGFTRTGKCETNDQDQGTHLVCSRVTDKFLNYTKSKGNDLSTPTSWFPGLKNGDQWCLCVFRWYQAFKDGAAPPVVLKSTNKEALNYFEQLKVDINDLKNNSQPQSLTLSAQATPIPTKTYCFSETTSSARGNKRGSETKLSNEVSNAPDPKKPNKNPRRNKNQKDQEFSDIKVEKEASKLLNLNPSN